MPTNSRRKTGPSTPEGKLKCSLNALKHGFTARSIAALQKMDRDHGVPFENVLARLNAHYQPRDPIEEELVARIARCVWRLSLSASMESRLLCKKRTATRPGTSYEKIMRYERLVDIHLHRAIDTLERRRGQTSQNAQNSFPPRSN